MNGYDVMQSGSQIRATSETSIYKKRPSNRIQIQNLPKTFTQEGIDQILAGCGTVKKTNILNSETGPLVNVIFDTAEDAQKAVEILNEREYDGSNLKVEVMTNTVTNGRNNRPLAGGIRQKGPFQPGMARGAGIPVRLLVPSEYVGAIIGRKGQTIRTITTKCKARVDVHGKENSGLVEKVISIYGQPENCTNACKEILLVMQQEATINNRGEIILKMLTDDRYCGRIIGKEGKMIKKIRDDTGTKINVSNSAQEMAALYPDRVIAIRGSVDGMAQAEAAVSAKLAECITQEMQQTHNMGAMMMMPAASDTGYYSNNRPYDGTGLGYYSSMYPPTVSQQPIGNMGPSGGVSGPVTESCQIGVPNAAVGAIIGTAGSNIKQLMRDSGAFVIIESKKDGSDPPARTDPAVERIVTIKGNIDACWRAGYMIHEKMKMEGFGGNDDVRLKTIIRIPKSVVGRIIGKGGKNVRELQRATGAMIKLPEDPTTQGDDVAVELYGNFMSTQTAHSRIRALSNQTQQQNYANGGTPPMARGGSAPH
jgi:insulin-like growth factor 2 mRNA-binding protein 1